MTSSTARRVCVIVDPVQIERPGETGAAPAMPLPAARLGALTVVVSLAFLAVGAQTVRLAVRSGPAGLAAISEPIARNHARPDIVDRNGRLIVTDVEMPSLYADPSLILNRDEVVEALRIIFPDIEEAQLRRDLSDKSRRFVWIRRGLSTRTAQRVHDLGLPGLAFRRELKRAYPAGELAGHVLGRVNVDNKGLSGLERHIDETVGLEPVHGATLTERAPVRLSLDLGVQHALEDELKDAAQRYRTSGAMAVVLDVRSGEVLAAASLPGTDPARLADAADPVKADKLAGGTFELGSILKIPTLALALESGIPASHTVDVREPLTHGRFTIKDPHPSARPFNLADIFVHSSNVGAARLALEAGTRRQQRFLRDIGLIEPARTEAGPIAPPQLPERWDRLETITIAYGHGIAVAPLQFAAAAAATVNGGWRVTPTFLKSTDGVPRRTRALSAETSLKMRELLRLNVTHPSGTGRRAEVAGLEVGGKTGTAEIARGGRYAETAVISSFLAAFPMSAPRYLTLVSLVEPKGSEETQGRITASTNAAPASARLIERIAPLLDLPPRHGAGPR